jgi:hypothetical protein
MTVKRIEQVTCDHCGEEITIDGFPCVTINDLYQDRRLHFSDYEALAAWAMERQAGYVAHRDQHFAGVEQAIARTAEILATRAQQESGTAPVPPILTEGG